MNVEYRSQLRESISERFGMEDIRNLCFDIGVDYENLGGEGKENKVRELILSLERAQKLSDLILYCQKKRPDFTWVLPNAEEPNRNSSQYSQIVERGLNVLTDIPEVRDFIVGYRLQFKTASTHIVRLDTYKKIHDQLHNLENACYDPLEFNVVPYPLDSRTLSMLQNSVYELERILFELKAIPLDTLISPVDIAWIADLEEADSKLNEVISLQEKNGLKEATRKLQRVLALRMPPINTRLQDMALALGLSELQNGLSQISDILGKHDINVAQKATFEKAADALSTLNDNLIQLLSRHDVSQEIDINLRMIKSSASQRDENLQTLWEELKTSSETLTLEAAASWTKNFQTTIEKLDIAIISNNSKAIETEFYQYCRLAGLRFFELDRNLLGMCSDLRKICEPLNQLVEAKGA